MAGLDFNGKGWVHQGKRDLEEMSVPELCLERTNKVWLGEGRYLEVNLESSLPWTDLYTLIRSPNFRPFTE